LWSTADNGSSCKLQAKTEARAAYTAPPAGTARQVWSTMEFSCKQLLKTLATAAALFAVVHQVPSSCWQYQPQVQTVFS
jgi:hypothetical protein